MKHILIIAEDVVKIQTLTGILGRAYSSLALFWLKAKLNLTIGWYRRFFKVSVLTSDCFEFKQVNAFYYSRELSRLNYADKRLWYWQETNRLLDKIRSRNPDWFSESGVNITRLFATRLCSYLAYNFLVYPQVEDRLIKKLRPNRVINFHSLIFVINRWLFAWLLNREYRQKLNLFLAQSQISTPQLSVRLPVVLLSLDFFRHLKTLKPVYEKLKVGKYAPILVTDIKSPQAALKNFKFQADWLFLAAFLPKAPQLAKTYFLEAKEILKDFKLPFKPMLFYGLVLSKLYLAAGRELFKKIKPKQIITVSDVRFVETCLSALAKTKGINSLLVSPNVILDLAEINDYDTTDKVALAGDFIKGKLINQGLSPKKLFVVGDLQSINRPQLTKEQVFRLLEITD